MASGDKLAPVADAVVAALVRPLGARPAHRASAAVVGVLDALHAHIVSNDVSRLVVKGGDLRERLRRRRCGRANVKPIWSVLAARAALGVEGLAAGDGQP